VLRIFQSAKYQQQAKLAISHRLMENSDILVASVSGPLDNEFDEGMKTFSHKKFDWEKIKSNCKKFYVFHSNNDPYIPLKDAENLARELGVGLTLIRNGKHLNRDAGYAKFRELLEAVKKIL